MDEVKIINQLELKLNLKFTQSHNPRELYTDLASKEAVYSLNSENFITALKITGYELTEIPDEIKNLSKINILNLSKNKIVDVKKISKLKTLTAINFSNNEISEIATIGLLNDLRWVNLNKNKIQKIENLSTCTKLAKLYVDDNLILNANIVTKLQKLQEFSASNNKISSIEEISKVQVLRKLDLSHNNIKDINEITRISTLQELNLSYNQIVQVPDLKEMREIAMINISFNKITEIPSIKRTVTVNAKGNPFTDIYLFSEPDDAVLNVDWITEKTQMIIEQIDNDKGSMLGIFGKWGRGKSFFWKVLKGKLEKKNYDIVEFLAWKYHDTPATWAYLYETFVNKFFKKPKNKYTPGWFVYSMKRFVFNVIRDPENNIFRLFFGLVVPVLLLLGLKNNSLSIDFIKKFFGEIGYFGLWGSYLILIYYYFSKVYSLNMPNIFKQISNKNFENVLGMQAAIEKELIFIFKRWKKKVILFVDDLDRCNEETILQIIDSLRMITEDEYISQKLTVIAAIDERILKRVIRNKYIKMVEEDKLEMITREYMDKLFVFGVKLAQLNNDEKQEIFDNYTRNLQLLFGRPHKYSKHKYSVVPVVSSDDFQIIKDSLTKQKQEITPRQIRIIFNRYLLAKEILKDKLKIFDDIDPIYNELLISMILLFSLENKIEDLKSFITYENINEEIKRTVYQREYTLSANDWLIFLHVIEQVVPY